MRSFADANGDGVGDLAGIRARLPYLRGPRRRRALAQPVVRLADGRRRLRRRRLPRHRPGLRHPRRGRGADRRGARARPAGHHRHRAQPLLRPAPVVPGGARRGPGSPDARPVLVPPRPRRGRRPAAERLAVALRRPGLDPGPTDGSPGWYLHMFDAEQPDLNWDNPEVRAEFEDVLRFWFDRGVDGFRIDVAHGLVKDPALPDVEPGVDRRTRTRTRTATRSTTIYRGWRRIADCYPGEPGLRRRGLAADAEPLRPLPAPRRAALRVQLRLPLLPVGRRGAAPRHRRHPRRARRRSAPRRPGCCPTTTSPGTSPATAARRPASTSLRQSRHGAPTDLALGRRRARAAALLTLALPGGVYVYQGEELGLRRGRGPARRRLRQDPIFAPLRRHRPRPRRLPGAAALVRRRGRRSASPRRRAVAPAAGRLGTSWTVEAQDGDPDSMLSLYRAALRPAPRRTRRSATARWRWLGRARRRARVHPRRRRLRVRGQPVRRARSPCPPATVLLASGPLDGGRLPTDTAAWLRV